MNTSKSAIDRIMRHFSRVLNHPTIKDTIEFNRDYNVTITLLKLLFRSEQPAFDDAFAKALEKLCHEDGFAAKWARARPYMLERADKNLVKMIDRLVEFDYVRPDGEISHQDASEAIDRLGVRSFAVKNILREPQDISVLNKYIPTVIQYIDAVVKEHADRAEDAALVKNYLNQLGYAATRRSSPTNIR